VHENAVFIGSARCNKAAPIILLFKADDFGISLFFAADWKARALQVRGAGANNTCHGFLLLSIREDAGAGGRPIIEFGKPVNGGLAVAGEPL
jgi:hypothetical protein